jgi:hypothetical protein
MTIVAPLLFVIIGLILWLVPFTGNATRLNDVGKWTYIIAFAVWLGLGR